MASIITAPGVQDIEALKLDPNLTNQYVSVDSDMVNNDMANKLKRTISDNYDNVTKRFHRLGGDFKEISKCVSGKRWISNLEKLSENCINQGKYTSNRKKELEEAFNVDENEEALQVMFKYLQTQPEFVAFYNANAKSDSSSVNFSGN